MANGKSPVENPPPSSPGMEVQARRIVRQALKAALATLDRTSGHPFASLVTVATAPDGTPLLLLSGLALHAQNLAADPRASLLFDATDGLADPMTGGRVTLVGTCRKTTSTVARRRFLARHQRSESYADFGDFAFCELVLERAHFIAGFGRIVGLASAAVKTDVADAGALIDHEPTLVARWNAITGDERTKIAGLAGALPDSAWRITGVDPEGIDFIAGFNACRVAFAKRVATPAEADAAWSGLLSGP